ncbi:50S ribosomal protein L4 [Buchnera aphidicola (Ceratovacuna keduensis)]|uniref:50S ribosomal protein L4 n=1 Tax=Buchnera aphidicola TaxID=9 RepID=UPI0031B7F995
MKLFLKDSNNDFINLSNSIFNRSFNIKLIHQVLSSYISISKKGTKSQKSKAEVSGSGKKPWKQKGTGRARVGSIRSPIWRSGGVTFAYKYRNNFKKVNKKMYKGAIKSIFSELIRKNKLIVFKELSINYPKTKLLVEKLKFINFNKILIILSNFDRNIFLSSRNIKGVFLIEHRFINPLILLSYDVIVTNFKTLKEIEKSLHEI